MGQMTKISNNDGWIGVFKYQTLFDNKQVRVIVLALCSTLHISINVPSINQFHSKTSESLSENKILSKTLTYLKGR